MASRLKRKAVLRFTLERAHWEADGTWHLRQKGRNENGHYLLEIPYSGDREFVLYILKYGAAVEVPRPKSLRKKILGELFRAASQYRARASLLTG